MLFRKITPRAKAFFPNKSSRKQSPGVRPSFEHLEEKVLLSTLSPLLVTRPVPGHTARPASGAAFTGYGLTPAQVRAAYGVNNITFQSSSGTTPGTGAGETIAIVDAYDDPSIAADLANFDQQLGLAAPPQFTKVGINSSGAASTAAFPTADQGWATEIELDVEWAHAIAPQANILLVEAASANDGDLLNAVNYTRNYAGVVAVSMSWGGSEFSGQANYDSYFTTPSGHAGMTFIASSGDNSSIGFPATSSHVVGVGGTALSVDSAGNYLGETAWSTSGGGISQVVAQPGYQSGLVIHNGSQTVSSGGMRAGPDVSWVADPNTGVAVYGDYGFGGWAVIGGTSAGAPEWAGLMAIVAQERGAAGLGSLDGYTQTLPAIYQLAASDFHDITSGANGNGLAAGPGFDLVTGRGSPLANLVVPALANFGVSTSASAPTVAQAARVVSATATTASLSVLGADAGGEPGLTYTWGTTGTVPGSVSFSANGTNAAKNSMATFTRAGSYTLQVTIRNAAGLSTTSQISVTVNQTLTSIAVTPASATIAAGATKQFAVTASDQFGVAMTAPAGVTWSIDAGGVGSVNATSGLYTAPSASGGLAPVRATLGSLTATASVTVTAPSATVATTSTMTAGPVSYPWFGYPTTTLTVTINPTAGTALPTGTVQLYYNGSVIGTSTIQIVNGKAVARFTVRFSTYGNYAFTAQYLGTSGFQASASNTVIVSV